jgi:3-oxoacyl-[acyl-carrier-protein] synthase III
LLKIGISAIGTSVPEKVLTNADLEKMVETSDAWIVARTGIRERHVLAREEGLRPHVLRSARIAMERAGIGADDLDFIISSVIVPDRFCPAQSYEAAHDLGAKRAFCLDLNVACSGFVYGLGLAESLIKSRGLRRGLITASEQMTTVTDYTDRNSCVLFGDAASAAVVTTDEPSHRILYTELGATPEACEDVVIGGLKDVLQGRISNLWFRQEGKKVFKFALQKTKELYESVPPKAGLKPEDIRYVIPHQANGRIIEGGADAVHGKAEFISVIERYGNTSAASIGLALHDSWDRFKPGDIIMLLGFGGGMSWGATLLEW